VEHEDLGWREAMPLCNRADAAAAQVHERVWKRGEDWVAAELARRDASTITRADLAKAAPFYDALEQHCTGIVARAIIARILQPDCGRAHADPSGVCRMGGGA